MNLMAPTTVRRFALDWSRWSLRATRKFRSLRPTPAPGTRIVAQVSDSGIAAIIEPAPFAGSTSRGCVARSQPSIRSGRHQGVAQRGDS